MGWRTDTQALVLPSYHRLTESIATGCEPEETEDSIKNLRIAKWFSWTDVAMQRLLCGSLSPTIWTDWHIPLLTARLTVFGAFEYYVVVPRAEIKE